MVYSTELKSHCNHVTVILNQLKEHQLYAKESKCSFGQSKVEYFGHIITVEGVAADLSKVATMLNWPKPSNIKQMRFLGITSYYKEVCKWILGCSKTFN